MLLDSVTTRSIIAIHDWLGIGECIWQTIKHTDEGSELFMMSSLFVWA
jgi:hypothetical protein